MSSENSLSFFGAGGHSHNGVNSTLIDTTRYSIFDFSLGFVGSQARINSQSVKQRSFEDYVIRIINNQVLQPAGLSLDPDTLNGKTIRANTITSTEIQAGTITANELTSNIVLVNNIIRSTNFDGTFHANGVISNSGTAGWGISYAGSSVFSNTVIRGTVTSTSGRIGPFDITDTSFRSNGYSPRNFMKIENFGDVTIYSQPNSGAHLNMIHRTDLVGEYILIEREGVTGRRAVMGSPDGNPNGMEFGLVDNGTQRFLAKTDGTIFASSSISGASLAVTGAITGASLAVTGAISGGAISGASLAVTGAITGASLTTTGNIKTNGGQLEVDNGGFIDGGITPGEQTTMNISGADLVIIGQNHNSNDFFLISDPVDDADTAGYQFLMWRTATGVVSRWTSKREIKDNITALEDVGSIIDQLQPVSFIPAQTEDHRSDPLLEDIRLKQVQYGFIAEDVAIVDEGRLAVWDTSDGEFVPAAWKPFDFISLLVREVQSLRVRVAELES